MVKREGGDGGERKVYKAQWRWRSREGAKSINGEGCEGKAPIGNMLDRERMEVKRLLGLK